MAGKLQVDINKLQNESLNILKRTDPNIVKILANASHAANYSFQQETNEWKKREVEGPFFVVQRKPTQQNQSMYAMIVLNRLNANNYIQYLNTGINFQVSDPYIIFRTQKETIGFWFGNASFQISFFHDLLREKYVMDSNSENFFAEYYLFREHQIVNAVQEYVKFLKSK